MTSQSYSALHQLGWSGHYEQLAMDQGIDPGRVARVLSAQRGLFLVSDGRSEWLCTPSGKTRHGARGDYPVTGDWVLVDEGVVQSVLPRRNTLRRGDAGARGSQTGAARREQPLGANIDTVFIVGGLDRDYNLRRLERFLTLVYNCGMDPVVVLTKADLHPDPDACREEVEAIALGVPVVLTSTDDRRGVEELRAYLGQGRTAAMIGSSGAGKSTLANMLCGSAVQATSAVSESVGKGRHTTTTRELIPLPGGGLLMDNPGIREIAFAQGGDGLDASFADILALARSCRFADCSHLREPGCAVICAVESGELPPERLENYRKMQREMQYAQARAEKSADFVERERWKGVAMEIKRMHKRDKR